MRWLWGVKGWFAAFLVLVAACIPTGYASATMQNWHTIAYWTPSSGADYGGEYQADIPDMTVNCVPNSGGLAAKTMWVPTNATNGNAVEFGWFKGLGYDGSCYTSVFYTGWYNSSGQYSEYHSQSGGNLTVGSWNTFDLTYYGLISGIPYYRASLNTSNFITVPGGSPYQSKLQIGLETDNQSTCLNSETYVQNWRTYNYNTGTFTYPNYAATTSDGAWLSNPVWATQYHDMQWTAGCGGV